MTRSRATRANAVDPVEVEVEIEGEEVIGEGGGVVMPGEGALSADMRRDVVMHKGEEQGQEEASRATMEVTGNINNSLHRLQVFQTVIPVLGSSVNLNKEEMRNHK